MTIIITDSRRRAAAGHSISEAEDPVVRNEDQVLVQPTSTYLEGTEPKNEHSEPYRARRSHAMELQALGIAKIVEPKKPAADEPETDEDDESEDEPETEQPDDESEQARAPRRRGRPRKA